MRILVCIKHVPAMEGGLGLAAVNPAAGEVEADGWFMNPLDQYALQYALRLAGDIRAANTRGAAFGEPRVIALSAGSDGQGSSEESLRLALALGADEAFLAAPLPPLADPATVSRALAELARLAGGADLALCGRQASDSNDLQVPYRLAALLGMAVLGDVDEIALASPDAAQSALPGGMVLRVARREGMLRETVEVACPAVLAVGRGREELPRPTLPGLMRAGKKPITRLEVSGEWRNTAGPVLLGVEPQRDSRRCRFAEGATPEARAAHLISMLRADGVLRSEK